MAGADAAPGTLSESPIRCGVMDRWQYLIVLAACLAITLPLEIFGDGVYRQPWRVVRAVLPVAAVFLVWDEVAIGAHVWTYNPAYIIGANIPFRMPIEEVLFFLVIPVCGLLTYSAVTALLERFNRR
jgi:lycopene cyclase domain-containing protein